MVERHREESKLGEGNHPRQKGTTRGGAGSLGNYGRTQYHRKSMGLGVEKLN